MSVALDRHRAPSIAPQKADPSGAEDDSDVSALIARLTAEVNQVACEKTRSIQQITNQMKMLALNALIESSRAGAQGAGFAVVAQEVRNVGQQVETIARELESQLTNRTGNLMSSISRMTDRSRGERMVDLSLNAIELIDRNLYERTCDVRWWATDSAVVDCAAAPDAATVSHVSERLAVILGAYTVYLDLWLCDLDGNVLANGRESWDELAILYAVRGLSRDGIKYFDEHSTGYNFIDRSDGSNRWMESPDKNQAYLSAHVPPAQLVQALEELILAGPKSRVKAPQNLQK